MNIPSFRHGAILCALALPLFGSCSEPLSMIVPDETTGLLDWTINLDVRCIASSDQEVASRHRLHGRSLFRVVRPVGDTRALIPIVDEGGDAPTISFTMHGNCDAAAHEAPVLVSQPSATTPWTVEGAIIEAPGVDSLRITISGRITPAVARFRMKDASSTLIEKPVIDSTQSMTFTLPYSVRAGVVQRSGTANNGAIGYSYSLDLLVGD